ncbi:hypothetical protein AM587_10013371 [Phytophthora nicotianae]|uniref:Uncharacterized protein n=1 Tax=Phytophthora nicotianae TaxID=4792 RepID=A0A0W8DKA1_PHYNI|nr:hypothetical protein AM587_10013371 [Phytophthora nicotianae]
MLWQLSGAGFCLLLCIPIVRGLLAVRSLNRRARIEPRIFVLARSFHRPLYAACLLLVVLRVAFFFLIATHELDEMEVWLKVATFWLLGMPSAALAALYGYIVLFAVRLVFRRRWPGVTASASSGMLTGVFAAFCTSLVMLVTLVATCRAEGGKWGLTVPAWMTFGYTAVIWTTLGLLMMKYEGEAVRILWRYRRRNQWSTGDGQQQANRYRQRLPVLSISCLKNMAVCSTLLAELLVVRGVLCAVAASKGILHAVAIESWQVMTLHYFGWEIASVVIVLYMLHQTPIAVHCFSGTSSTEKPQQDIVAPSAPVIDDVEIQVEFQIPSVRDIVSDYVVPSNVSLFSTQRSRIERENLMESRYCRIHHSRMPSTGVGYINCRCYRERNDDALLNNASVPLLSEGMEVATHRNKRI